jgi:protein-tyrosine phosphatase
VIDLHCHILPGVDDGPRTLDESLEIARSAAEDGVELVAATPHVRGDYPTSADTMDALLRSTKEAVVAAGIPLVLRGGAEIAIDFLPGLGMAEVRRFGLAGNPRYVLLEFPYGGWPLGLDRAVRSLRAAELTPVLAHPERNPDVQGAPGRLGPLVADGALVQLTAGSLTGAGGSQPRKAARALLDLGLAHLIAGDAHAASVRKARMREAAAAVGDDALGRWLTFDVPRAIVLDEPLPERPAKRPGRFRLRRK